MILSLISVYSSVRTVQCTSCTVLQIYLCLMPRLFSRRYLVPQSVPCGHYSEQQHNALNKNNFKDFFWDFLQDEISETT